MNLKAQHLFHADQQILFRQGAEKFIAALQGANAQSIVVGLPGGRSIVGLLEQIMSVANSLASTTWRKVHFFMLDERLVPLDSEESNFRLLQERFFHPLLAQELIDASQLHPFIYQPGKIEQSLAAYEKALNQVGGKFHLTVLGVGEDAHVGALFPQHQALKNFLKNNQTNAPSAKFISLQDSPKPPPQRMTSSAELIADSNWGMALFIGQGKRDALNRYYDSTQTVQDCPVKVIDNLKEKYLLTDICSAQSI